MSIKKKVRVSKNRKKSWRKHTDINEIEEYLDNKGFEERVGLTIREAKDEDLFIIEKSGDDSVYQEKLEQIQSQPKKANVADSKLRKISSGYRLYEKLKSTSKVPAVNSREPNKERRKTIYNDDSKLEKLWQDKKESIQHGKKLKEKKKNIYNDPKLSFQCYDLWDGNNDSEEQNDYLKSLEKLPIKVPEHLRQKPSLLPAVEVPVGGQSYNPDKDEYNDLVNKVVEKEVTRINEEAYWTHKVEKHFVPKDEIRSDDSSCYDISSDEEEEQEEDNVNDEEILKFTKQVRAEKKKTKAQRKRELREKLAKRKKEEEKKLKMKESQVFRIRTFKKELEEREKKLAQRASIRAKKHIESLYKPKRLTRYNFEEPEIEINMPNEVTGSLRSMKVEGHLLEDRFKSLQKRNIIETRVRQNRKRKFKLKKEVKKRHKVTN